MMVPCKPMAKRSGKRYIVPNQNLAVDMTICVAAICKVPGSELSGVVIAADRKFTIGDMGYEQSRGKYYGFNKNVVGLVSGNLAIQMRMLLDTSKGLADPANASVEEVAEAFAAQYRRYRSMWAEQQILAPLGHTLASFTTNQRDFEPGLLHKLYSSLNAPQFEAETIIAGIDAKGAHIYTIGDPGLVYNHNPQGFAAIGEGWHHAHSHFTESKYTAGASLAFAFYTTFAAKRLGEVANSVGRATDLLAVLPDSGVIPVRDDLHNELSDIFDKAQAEHRKVTETAHTETEGLVARVLAEPRPQPVTSNGPTTAGTPPLDRTGEKPDTTSTPTRQVSC